jgi:hypothetical protein
MKHAGDFMHANDHVKKAAQAHTNLNMWAAIQAIIDGGCFCGTRPHKACSRILRIIKAERERELMEYDVETEMVRLASLVGHSESGDE